MNNLNATRTSVAGDGSYLEGKETYVPSNYTTGLNNGDTIWDKLIRKHANISMVVCGHISCDTIICSTATGDAGNTVYQLMMDAQDTDKALSGIGLVNFMHFTEDGRYARLESYSTTKKQYFHQANTWLELDFGEWTPAIEQAPEPAEANSPSPVIWVCAGVAAVIALAVILLHRGAKSYF